MRCERKPFAWGWQGGRLARRFTLSAPNCGASKGRSPLCSLLCGGDTSGPARSSYHGLQRLGLVDLVADERGRPAMGVPVRGGIHRPNRLVGLLDRESLYWREKSSEVRWYGMSWFDGWFWSCILYPEGFGACNA